MKFRSLLVVAVVFALLAGVTDAFAQAPLFGRIPKVKFRPYVSPIGNFQVDVPRSGWMVLSGRGDAVLLLADTRTGAATVAIERHALRGVLGPADISVLANSEVTAVGERERGAADIQSSVLAVDGRQVVAVTYSRVGIKGREYCVTYAVPLGETMFRVVANVTEKERPRFAPLFGHIAASVQTPPAVSAR